ncbi:MAG: sensor domain-containing diguanylate cyclase [Alphaproteobacteria bacterium]|nr:sensor domain-containing diguanylate cyclase [Alphaproteobacteria bacterium]
MLSTNIFYSGYNIVFSILSLFIGIGTVFLVRNSKVFRSLFLFQLGGLTLILLTYLTVNDHVLYKFGLNYNFVAFVQIIISLIISVLWINSAADFHHNGFANREALTVYMSFGLTACIYYSFVEYNIEYATYLRSIFTITGITLLFISCLTKLWKNINTGNLLFALSLLMLENKLIVSSFFYQYNWLNLNIFNWLWIYVFAVAVVFMKFDMYKTDLQKSWNSIDKLNLQLMNIIDTAPDPIILLRRDNRKLYTLNSKAVILLGVGKKEIRYHGFDDFFIDEENREKFISAIEENGEIKDFDLMACNIISGSPFWISASAKILEYNNIETIYIVLQDIALRKEREASLHNIADRDPLTSGWNIRYFEKVAASRAQECIKNGQNFSLLLIDADKFKKINEKYGHQLGDKVLIKMAEICRNSVREDDVVARYGGEEFIIFLNNTNTRTAVRVAERLRQSIEDDFIKNENDTIKFTASIGVVSSEKTASIELLLRQVDDAMYQAKRDGRNKVAVYNEQEIKTSSKKKKSPKNSIHPVFRNEENEEISLLDSYESRGL